MKLSIAISILLLVVTADARKLKQSKAAKSENKKCPKTYSQTHNGKIVLTRYSTFDETLELSNRTRF